MTETIGGCPTWRLVFDKDGDADPQTLAELRTGIGDNALSDVVLFSHGWNNDEAAASSLYDRWFGLLAPQLSPQRRVGFVGIRWPSQLWRDEPIPEFPPAPGPQSGGAAALAERPTITAGPPTIDPAQLSDLKEMFPAGGAALDRIAALLAEPPAQERAPELFAALQELSAATATGCNDGETGPSTQPGMLDDDQDPVEVFTRFADRLADAGVRFGDGGGAAGLTDFAAKIFQGAKEALRQLTYWQMKNRAGVIGQRGLGPIITALADEFPELRVHLIGHSFGARLVSFALAGLAASRPPGHPSPVKAVTLLEAAYSRFAFADPLPFSSAAGPNGALAGTLDRLDGPLTVCYSSHDRALSVFYPLASAAAGQDSAGAADPLARWRAMGSLGAFNVGSHPLGPEGTGYPFQTGEILNLDASEVVTQGNSASGAHSDIFYPQLTWVAAAAGGLHHP